ncbi:MAG TPA: hypothetical protein VIV88_12315 [Gemmatimonadales bacterium]|jgi:hypothetical protein
MRAVQLSAGALGLGLVLLATAVRRATHVQVLASGTESAFPSTVTSVPIPAAGYGLDRLLTALGKDPFHPERRRPNRRFQLPSDLATRVARRPDDQPASSLRLIGTAVTGDAGSGFAMCAWQGGTPRIVRVGEQVSGWTLVKVTPGAADFATPGGRVTVRVPKAGT